MLEVMYGMYNTVTNILKLLASNIGYVLTLFTFCNLIVPKLRNWTIKKINKLVRTDEQNDHLSKLSSQLENLSEQIKKQNEEQNTHMKAIDKTLETYQEALVCSLAKDLKYMCKDIAEKEVLSEDDYKVIQATFSIYKQLGGNGYISKLVDKTLKKPLEFLCPTTAK